MYVLADVVSYVLAVGTAVALSWLLVSAASASGVAAHAAVPGHAPVAACCAKNNPVVVGEQSGADLVS